jgi:hypothetical protein
MAARFLVAGGTGNWDSTTNWSATSGGASGATAPTVADTVALDSLSGNAPLTVNVSSAALSFIASGTYAGTVTFNAQLAVSGAITLIAGMTLAGTTGPLVPNATATLTSGGKTIPCPLTFGASATYTLADNWTVTGLVTAGVTTGTTTLTSNQITCAGGFTKGGTTAIVGGTTKLVMTGGTFSSGGTGGVNNPIDLAGNVTISGAITYGTAGSPTLRYLSGTITTTGSTLTMTSGGVTLNTAGMTWDSITSTIAGTLTNSSALAGSGTLTIGNASVTTIAGAGAINWTGPVIVNGSITLNNTGGLVTTGALTLPNAAMTFGGSAGFTVGTLTTASLTASRTYTFTFGNTYTVNTALSNVGTTAAIRQAIVSSVPGSKVVFKVTPGASETLLYCDPTDIDSSSGALVVSINGVITTSLNWSGSVTAVSAGAGSSFYHYGRRR